ncbi:MAG: low temperature requirement protein A [Thermoleophilaceae bacterium]
MTSGGGASSAEVHAEPEQRVTPLELFFDLVFVFAITQVTSLMSTLPTWQGLAQGMLVLAALWWAWAAYAWLTNTLASDDRLARLGIFSAMAAMLVAALAAPKAFGDEGVLFGCAYFVVRVLHIVVYAQGSPDVGVRQAVTRLAPTAVGAPALLIVAGFMDDAVQGLLWAAALAIDYAGPAIMGPGGWRMSPAHFAERFGLIIIIALGESIVAIGVGASGPRLDAGVVVAAVLAVAAVAALWWAYFDVVAIVAERKFREARGEAQIRIARDSYSYLHLPMIAGIVLLALGIKKTVAAFDAPLDTVPAAALCGGIALYLLGHIGFRLRNVGTLNRQRLATALLLLALIPLATQVDALVALAGVTAASCGLVAYEATRFADARARVRAVR